MKKSIVLDCTLRDGGYCNKWKFGFQNTKRIITSLIQSGIEIIECGFLNENINHERGMTQFNFLDEIEEVLPDKSENISFVCMINYGAYNISKLPEASTSILDGIRIAFHKKDMKEALRTCRLIKEKGYKVFVQPMLSMKYTDAEFIDLIMACNDFTPYAFYIVDSFGTMKNKDLTRLFYLTENNLKSDIMLGFHSHNNMQLAYANAQELLKFDTVHKIIVDSSIMGMGRGAGNLNTELFLEYLNESYGHNYNLSPLLGVIDEVLNNFYSENYWGYSLPNYLSASYNAHPNYAFFFDDKKTLTVGAMNDLFCMMDEDKKEEFDKNYAETLYLNYMSQDRNEINAYDLLKAQFAERKVLLVAPGKSVVTEKKKVLEFVSKYKPIIICINYDCSYLQADYIFVSNLRRFQELDVNGDKNYIFTSNIHDSVGLKVNYSDLLNDIEYVKDNAGMMAIKLLSKVGIKTLYIAGIDGYSYYMNDNFVEKEMSINVDENYVNNINYGMKKCICELKKIIGINFITTSKLDYI